MQFIFDNGIYKIARITGPQHNLLGLRLSETGEVVKVVSLPIKNGEEPKVEEQEVLRQVEEGLQNINRELGRQYFISEVQYVPSDSESTSVYSFLTQELIRRIDGEGEFITI